MMKLVILSVLLGAAYSATVAKCMAKNGEKLESKTCEANTPSCKSPTISLTGGLSDVAYGCGACVQAETDKGCKACEEDDCNKEVMVETYECAHNVWETDKFKAKDKMQVCSVAKGTDKAKKICNAPGKEAKAEADYTVQNNGCGGCLKAQKDANKCAESGAAALTAFLVPLLAALYTLF